MSRKWMIIPFALVLACSVFLSNAKVMGAPAGVAVSLWPAPTFPAGTVIPSYSYPAVDATVSIPDANLKAALKTAAGLQPQASIYKSDLAKLSGGLDLSNKSIAKADGLQYCINITDLNLTGNKLTTLPGTFSTMTKLKGIILDDNKFTSMPDVVFAMPGLTSLSMASNTITKIPDKVNTLTALTYLNLSGNKLESISTNIGKCTALKDLNLSGNGYKLKTIPKEICLLPNLEAMDLSGNALGTSADLPQELTTMPKLTALNVENNVLSELPTGLGFAPSLQKIYASRNRLIAIEPSLLSSKKITDLTLDVNRLTDLPTGLSGMTFNTFSVEWNFIDMSEGSDARKIADSVNAAGGKNYLRQLKTITNTSKQETINTVVLRWQPLTDGTSGDSNWKVNKYQVYLDDNGKWVDLAKKQKPIAELDKYAGEYVVTGLQANTAYKFQVGVEYSLTLNGVKISAQRIFTEIDAKTLAANATAEVTEAPTQEPADTGIAESAAPDVDATPQPEEPAQTTAAAPAKGGNTTLMVILIIVGAVAAIAIVGIALMLTSKRGQKRPYR